MKPRVPEGGLRWGGWKATVLVVFVVLGVPALFVGALYSQQGVLIYPGQSSTPPGIPSDVEHVPLAGAHGWLMRGGLEAPLVIFAHGNAGTALHRVDRFRSLVDQGFSVLLVEYPGYGGIGGEPNFASIRAVMLDAYDVMRQRREGGNAVILWGRSLGGAAVSLIAAEREVDALVLESTFTSLPALVEELGVPGWLARDRFDTLPILRQLEVPVLIFHGRTDRTVPFHHGLSLSSAVRDGRFVEDNCGHECGVPLTTVVRWLASRGLVGTADASD